MRLHHRETDFSIPMTHNTGYEVERTVLPLPPAIGEEARFEMEIYARFMRHLRHVPNSRMDIKVLSSIQFTADMLYISDALVAKTLVDLGLRVPRAALPGSYLDFVDNMARRLICGSGQGVLQASVLALRKHWDCIGEEGTAGGDWKKYAVSCGEGTWISV